MSSASGPAEGDPASPHDIPLRTFWMAGFEGADHRNAAGHDHDPQQATGHLEQAAQDYCRLARLGIRTVRESLGWRLSERAGGFDFGRLRHLESAARQHGVQIIWSLMHYGVPDDVDYFDERFVERFCDFAEAAGREYRRISDDVPVWTPINEINFVSWALTESDHLWPHKGTRRADGYLLKRRLVRATLRAMEVLRAVDPRARFMHVEPVIHVVAPADRPDLVERASVERSWQWQAWDMLSGRIEPELGGGPHGLDLLGVSHYHSSQWELATQRRLQWHRRDPRRLPLSSLLAEVQRRYGRPVVIAETGHFGVGRAQWLDEMVGEAFRLRRRGVPLVGYCLYPAVDRPDWERADQWHHSGMWDVPFDARGRPGRTLNRPYARTLKRWQRVFAGGHSRRRMPTLIVFSHLRWNFVFQRPQQVLTRLAEHFNVLFVEEPCRGNATPFLERYSPARNVEVLRPRTTIDAPGFDDAQFGELRDLLLEYLDDFGIDDYIAWFYTPMAVPMLSALRPRAVVYDCMDELSAFRNAPARMLEREAELLRQADVVFTGGPSLYDAKRKHHSNVVCLPSAVDAAHYAPSATRALDSEVARLIDDIPRPRLGFFGVIDERLDIELVTALADARPDWQLMMVGPVVKIDVAQLPKRSNIHWLGQQDYARLPQIVACWDVCLLPFADNESTKFISPTKTLEYMAAERPIVSTPVRDVVRLYGDAVQIAATPQEFVAACSRALAETAEERTVRVARMRAHVGRTTWDATAQTMLRHLRGLAALRPTAKDRSGRAAGERLNDLRAAGKSVEALVTGPLHGART